MLREILVAHAPEIVNRFEIIPFGTVGVGLSLGQMVKQKRFPKPSLVFLDGDQDSADGCLIRPGGDAPERVVFEGLKKNRWEILPLRTGRSYAEIEDACNRAMTIPDHHEWVMSAAKSLLLGGDTMWQILASAWAKVCLDKDESQNLSSQFENFLVCDAKGFQIRTLPNSKHKCD